MDEHGSFDKLRWQTGKLKTSQDPKCGTHYFSSVFMNPSKQKHNSKRLAPAFQP
jgi:hypothetical protein